MDFAYLNRVRTYVCPTKNDLIDFAVNEKKILIAINSEKILNATKQTRQIINNNIGYSDGMAAVWALKKKGFKNVIKIPGCELWLEIIKKFYKEKSFYLIGSTQKTIEQTVSKLKKEFEGINIVNFRNGYFHNESEKKEVLEDIVLKKPDIIFVAMGSPKQELFMYEMEKVHSAVYQGVGGSLDLYTGKIKPVPEWWKKIFKWEGLYRSFMDFNNWERWKRQKNFFIFIFAVYRNKI